MMYDTIFTVRLFLGKNLPVVCLVMKPKTLGLYVFRYIYDTEGNTNICLNLPIFFASQKNARE